VFLKITNALCVAKPMIYDIFV